MPKDSTIVFYDATCVLCDRSILWLIKNDFEDSFRFSHLNSSFAKQQSFPISQILDVFYFKIAANRYRWFGNYDNCKIPDERIKHKFLDF